jgi:protein-tyrosine-phosphatase
VTFPGLNDVYLAFLEEGDSGAALEGRPMAENAPAVLEEAGIYPETHRARQVSREMLEKAELVLVMDPPTRRGAPPTSRDCAAGAHTLPGYARVRGGYP